MPTHISKFDPDTLLNDATILVLGKRRTGKSWMLREIMYHKRHIPFGIVFSGTEDTDPFFNEFIPEMFIYNKYDSSVMSKMMERQKKRVKAEKKKPSNNRFIILDDLQCDAKTWKRDETIQELFYNGRHCNFLLIIALQFITGITPGLRANLDYIFVFNDQGIKNRRTIYEEFAAHIPDFGTFSKIMDYCTTDHKCLVLKVTGDPEIFFYEAKDRDNFKVGSESAWDYHKKRFNDGNTVSSVAQPIIGSNAKNVRVNVGKDGCILDYSFE